jgi:hypothetical protein
MGGARRTACVNCEQLITDEQVRRGRRFSSPLCANTY